MHLIGLQALRAKIRGFHVSGSAISSRICKSKGDKRARLWIAKRALGAECRYHLIAYALLRGIPYHKVERCAQNNRPNPEKVLRLIQEHSAGTSKKYDLDLIVKLLEPQENSQENAVRG